MIMQIGEIILEVELYTIFPQSSFLLFVLQNIAGYKNHTCV